MKRFHVEANLNHVTSKAELDVTESPCGEYVRFDDVIVSTEMVLVWKERECVGAAVHHPYTGIGHCQLNAMYNAYTNGFVPFALINRLTDENAEEVAREAGLEIRNYTFP